MVVVALTGGMATGKSVLARHFESLGARVLDADQIAREVVEPGQPALEEIRGAFGEDILTPSGSLDRAAMANIIFADPKARADLEAIVHPRVAARMRDELNRWRADGFQGVAVLEIPLFFESKESFDFVDRVVVVCAPKAAQIERLVRQRGFDAAEAERRLEAQWPTERKAARADFVIDNSGSLERAFREVERVWEAVQGCE